LNVWRDKVINENKEAASDEKWATTAGFKTTEPSIVQGNCTSKLVSIIKYMRPLHSGGHQF